MHHALLCIGEETGEKTIKSICEEFSIDSGDIRQYRNESFPVEDVRNFQGKVYTTPLSGSHTLSVIAVQKIDVPSQNALLKMTEEPPAHAFILLIIPHEDMLLPTLRSRFVRVDGEDAQTTSLGKEFLEMSVAEKQKYIEKLHKGKDTQTARKIIRELETIFGSKGEKEQYRELLSDLIAFRQYAEQRGASVKYMLEHLALTLPKI